MKSFSNVVLVVLAVVGMMNIVAIAQADVIYTAWSGNIKAYDVDTGAVVSPPTFTSYPDSQGVALSPTGNELYLVYKYSGSTYAIASYNAGTGALIDATYATMGVARGLASDSDGNLYAALNDRHIAKIDTNGDVDPTWGNTAGYYALDLEVYDGKLYGGIPLVGAAGGVAVWDLNDISPGGVDPTYLTDQLWVNGVTFDADGTLYTADQSTYEVRKWDSTFELSNSTVIASGFSLNMNDIDYYDGKLFLNVSGKILRCNVSAPTVWTEFAFISRGAYMAPQIIPEPGTLTLLACGLVGLLAYAWRKRK